MKKRGIEILNQYCQNDLPSEKIKEKVMNSARLYILARDLGELFTAGLGTPFSPKKTDDESSSQMDTTKK